MAKNKRESSNFGTIKVGDISDINGAVNIAGADISIRNTNAGFSAAGIKRLFDQVYSAIETRPKTSPADKTDL